MSGGHTVWETVDRRVVAAGVALLGVVAVAGSFAVTGRTPAFVVTPVNAWVVRTTPAAVVAWSIQQLGTVGESLAFLLSLALTVVLLGVVGVIGIAIGRRFAHGPGGVAGGFTAVWGITVFLTGAPVDALGAGIPAAVAVALWSLRTTRTAATGSRRRVLVSAAGLLGYLGLASVLGFRPRDGGGGGLGGVEPTDIESALELAADLSLDVDGLEPLVSAIGDFYEIDIATINPNPDVDDWRLDVTGAVDTPVTVTFDDLTAITPEHQFITLRCVGEQLNGTLMDNALWTGVPAAAITERAGVSDTATHVRLGCLDDYEVVFPVEAFRNGFLAYGMNGEPLPRGHGFPVRALIPGHWGETNAKWLTEIEFLTMARDGYWERRGWHGTGPVNTVAKLHVENHRDDGTIEVGGHAYAGTRGIKTVEVSVDGGTTWTEATLSDPLPGTDVWRQWVHTYTASESHEVVVRAIDGTGMVQTEIPAAPFPSGATGLVRRTIRP